jgi:transcription antitermination factor NusG
MPAPLRRLQGAKEGAKRRAKSTAVSARMAALDEGCGPAGSWPQDCFLKCEFRTETHPGAQNGGSLSINHFETCSYTNWLAIQVRPRSERLIALVLKHKGYEEFLTLHRVRRQWSDRVKDVELPLFPGYVFARMSSHMSGPIVTTSGVIRIVGIGNAPVPVEDSEIEMLQSVARSGLAVAPWSSVQVGQRVRILAGPLRGTEGLVARLKDKWRLVVAVTLLPRSVAVEIDHDWITPICSPAVM